MAYQKQKLGLLIEVDPRAARAEILKAYETAKASQRDAATELGCSETTLIRWIKLLDLQVTLLKLKKRAIKENWHHVNQTRGGRPPGSRNKPKAPAKKSKAA